MEVFEKKRTAFEFGDESPRNFAVGESVRRVIWAGLPDCRRIDRTMRAPAINVTREVERESVFVERERKRRWRVEDK